ncbi:muconolactone Delta-isomerase family protein [Microbacterium testaceum]|uniref:muconolactone Delta-isomerase family protein n=1 Tax=Microbacterium testaceum TaxID=2033 RepID=UPI001CD94B57|nr:muconolactone Delta-isomerase family protein [Microbacterium testaceum]
MSAMQEFLVNIDVDTGDLESEEVDQLKRAERERALELAAEGFLQILWRIPGRWANVGVWRAPNREMLLQALGTLPLRPFMSIDIQELEEHPNDPRTLDEHHNQASHSEKLEPLPELPIRTRSTGRGPLGRAAEISQVSLPELPELTMRSRRLDESPSPIPQHAPATTGAPWVTLEIDLTSVLLDVAADRADERVRLVVENAAAEVSSAGSLSLSHSGRNGLDSAGNPSPNAALTIDIGRVRRAAMIRPLPGGEDAIQIRTVATLTATGTGAADFDAAGDLLRKIRDTLTNASELDA